MMMDKTVNEQDKILVPVDGSERSMKTIRYIAGFAPFKNMKVVLFNVFHKIPEFYWDLTNTPMMNGRAVHMASWEQQNREIIDRFMEKSVAILRTSGFAPGDLEVKVENLDDGVTRDIITEARKGYAAVVARRRGFTKIPGIMMGSVADKLMNSLDFVPLFFVGAEPVTDKILMAMDNSASAMAAVAFVAGLSGHDDSSVTLVHVVREDEIFSDDYYGADGVGRNVMLKVFEDAREQLTRGGYNHDNIHHKVITGAGSRAGTIARVAEEEDYATIVLGRQGVSKVRDFFLGRVSKKVIHAAHSRTVCIV
ncbi:MAG: universal stress protein [Desulfobacteraceae bacterium]|nr:universal stress protein [Desulfobacteraceae bacterium]